MRCIALFIFILLLTSAFVYLCCFWYPIRAKGLPSYILLFYIGTVAYRNNWLESITPAILKVWKRITLIALPVFPI